MNHLANRMYAQNLLVRAAPHFSLSDLDAVESVLPYIEAEIATFLERYVADHPGEYILTSRAFRDAATATRAGKYRPPFTLYNDDGTVRSRHNGDGSVIEGEGL